MNTLSDADWKRRIRSVAAGNCSPFLGAGAGFGSLPLGRDIAQDWAREYAYPFEDTADLIRVAQYLAVTTDPLTPKDLILQRFKDLPPPNFREPDEPHGVLARLPMPVFITTNYDDFMYRALTARNKSPRREMCRWNHLIKDVPSVFETEPGYKPSAANPLVFHLHGHSLPESLVLTEDDYLRFLAAMSGRWSDLIPRSVQEALDRKALVFIGYRLADWNFRVLLQGLRPSAQRRSYLVIPPPTGPGPTQEKGQSYMEKYYGQLGLTICWATAREFCGELRRRWREFADD